MSDFPRGYEFYDHHKGPPDGKVRHDVYLYGKVVLGNLLYSALIPLFTGPENTTKLWRFRSVPEFLPHARWLYDMNSNEPCQCKYCSGIKSQREITATLDVPHLVRGGPRTSGTALARSPRNVTQRLTARRRKPTPPGQPPSRAAFDTPLEHVHRELHADLTNGKAYRKGEIVWATVNPPIIGSSSNEMIIFWPAVVSDRHIKIEQSAQGRAEIHMYDIRYFPHAQNHVLPESGILPLQAYRVPSALSDSLSRFRPAPDADYEASVEKWTTFRVLPKSAYDAESDVGPPSFQHAAPAYIIAVRLSDYITQLYRPDLEWNTDASPFQTASRPTRISGVAPPADHSKTPLAKQNLYQGMWWGPERIWMGDLVRLKPERSHFPADVQSHFRPLAPAPFSTGRPGVFLHIELIHSDPLADTADETSPQVTGTLWEVVSERWSEPEDKSAPMQEAENPTIAQSSSVTSWTPTAAQKKPTTLLDSYPLPPSPPRSKWRPILLPGMEVKIPVQLIAGRYYPNILKHPIVSLGESLLNRLIPLEAPLTLSTSMDGSSSTISPRALFISPSPSRSSTPVPTSPTKPIKNSSGWTDPAIGTILALAGLERGWFHSSETKYWSVGRVEMLQQALKAACEEIWAWFQTPVQDNQNIPNTPSNQDSVSDFQRRHSTSPGEA